MEINPLCDICARDHNIFNVYMTEGEADEFPGGIGFACVIHGRLYHPERGYFSRDSATEVTTFVKYCGQNHCTLAKYIASAQSSLEETWTFRCVGDHE
jgi:hypothetical protein